MPRQVLKRVKNRGVILTEGPVIRCPICGEGLMKSDIGVHAHLKKHVRAKELDGAELRTTKDKLLG